MSGHPRRQGYTADNRIILQAAVGEVEFRTVVSTMLPSEEVPAGRAFEALLTCPGNGSRRPGWAPTGPTAESVIGPEPNRVCSTTGSFSLLNPVLRQDGTGPSGQACN